MATSSESIKTISIVSLLGLLMFSVVWLFASGAVVSIPPHSLRTDLLEIGRPIQAIAIDTEAGRRPNITASVPGTGPVAPEALVAFARPVAAVVQQLTQPIPAVDAPSDGDPLATRPKASSAKRGEGKAKAVQPRSKAKGQESKDRFPPGLSKQIKAQGKKKA